MDICTFNDHYLNTLLEKLSKEVNKRLFFKELYLKPF